MTRLSSPVEAHRRASERLRWGSAAFEAPSGRKLIETELAAPAPELPVPRWANAEPSLGREGGMRDPTLRKERRKALGRLRRRAAVARVERGIREGSLHEVMVDFWSNYFSVDSRKGPVAALIPSYEYEVLRPHALGNFRELLHATASHPAMLFYLDNWRSAAPQKNERRARRRRRGRPSGLNENYARELLELHTVGADGGYTQRDVEAVAAVLSGWTLRFRDRRPRFHFATAWHVPGAQQVMGWTFSQSGVRQGEALLDALARHRGTAKRIAHRLAVRFLSDVPPPDAVERTARAFLDSDGDLRETLGALLLGGPELFSKSQRRFKSPLEFLATAIHRTGAPLRDGKPIAKALHSLGQFPYLAPTPAGYPEAGRAWIDPSSVWLRARLAFALASGRIPGIGEPTRDVSSVLVGNISETTERALARPGLTAQAQIALALASPEFQQI